MEIRVNKEQISHIEIYDTHIGVKSYWNNYIPYIWMEADYFKFLWLFKTPFKNYKEGFYRDSKRKRISNDTPCEVDDERELVVGDYIWTKPHIQIFCGKYKIKSIYFEDLKSAKTYCDKKFSNVNVTLK